MYIVLQSVLGALAGIHARNGRRKARVTFFLLIMEKSAGPIPLYIVVASGILFWFSLSRDEIEINNRRGGIESIFVLFFC